MSCKLSALCLYSGETVAAVVELSDGLVLSRGTLSGLTIVKFLRAVVLPFDSARRSLFCKMYMTTT